MRHRLVGISPKAYEHPADRAATAALQSIPMLDKAIRKLSELQYERALKQIFLAGSVKLGPDQLPEVWDAHRRACATLDLPEVYDLYLTQSAVPNALAIGADRPMILLLSELVDLLDDTELTAVLGHELGHVLSEHVRYRTTLQILLQFTVPRLPALAGIPLVALRTALLEWSRAAELTCDRAAALVTRDPLATCRTLMVLAAGTSSRRLNLDAFLRQAAEYEEWASGWDRFRRFFVELRQEHDFPVRRAAELMRWVRSGEYDRIVGGDYPRRTDPLDTKAYAQDTYLHYRERFRTIFREAQEGASAAADRIDDWLRPTDR